MTKLTKTQRQLVAMLTENTGRALCDSGDAYGRHWERNQGRDFAAEPRAQLAPVGDYVKDGSNFEPEVTISTFHFLSDALQSDATMNRRYQAFANRRRGEHYELEIMESFMDYLKGRGHEIAGLYGDGEPFTVNTYNGADLLTQTLQFLYFTCDGDAYVLLQVHGGADVRGGYTNAVAFSAGSRHHDETRIFDNARAVIVPDTDAAEPVFFDHYPARALNWSTDDAWNWYFDGSCGAGVPAQLNHYEVTRDESERGKGKVWLDPDGRPHCPLTGTALVVDF